MLSNYWDILFSYVTNGNPNKFFAQIFTVLGWRNDDVGNRYRRWLLEHFVETCFGAHYNMEGIH